MKYKVCGRVWGEKECLLVDRDGTHGQEKGSLEGTRAINDRTLRRKSRNTVPEYVIGEGVYRSETRVQCPSERAFQKYV